MSLSCDEPEAKAILRFLDESPPTTVRDCFLATWRILAFMLATILREMRKPKWQRRRVLRPIVKPDEEF